MLFTFFLLQGVSEFDQINKNLPIWVSEFTTWIQMTEAWMEGGDWIKSKQIMSVKDKFVIGSSGNLYIWFSSYPIYTDVW